MYNGQAENRLIEEVRLVLHFPVTGIFIKAERQRLNHWTVIFFGNTETLWKDAYIPARIFFPQGYPNIAPALTFKMYLYHPNIFQYGRAMNLSILENWHPRITIREVLGAAYTTFHKPFLQNAVNEQAKDDYYTWVISPKGQDTKWATKVATAVEDSQRFIVGNLIPNPKTEEQFKHFSRVEYNQN